MDQRRSVARDRLTPTRRDLMPLVAGAAALWPLAARPQQKPIPVIGYLSGGSPGPHASYTAAFRQGLQEAGYIEGRNVAIKDRWAEGRYDRLPALAADLVAQKVDIIVTAGGIAAWAAKRATSTIPIVFEVGNDPVAQDLVGSLARPGGNLTGIAFLVVELHPKRLELLSELLPEARIIALLVNPNNANNDRILREVQIAARAKGIELPIVKAGSETEIDTAFAALVDLHTGGLLVGADPLLNSRSDQLVVLASRYAIPAMYFERSAVAAAGLVSYGSSLTTVFRQLGTYTGRVLKGEKPADLPVQQPTKFELVVNLKTAKALGLTVPQSLLARADEVIE